MLKKYVCKKLKIFITEIIFLLIKLLMKTDLIEDVNLLKVKVLIFLKIFIMPKNVQGLVILFHLTFVT